MSINKSFAAFLQTTYGDDLPLPADEYQLMRVTWYSATLSTAAAIAEAQASDNVAPTLGSIFTELDTYAQGTDA